MNNEEMFIEMKDKKGNPVKCQVITTFELAQRNRNYIALLIVDEQGDAILNENGQVQVELFRYEVDEESEEQQGIIIKDIQSDMEFDEVMNRFGELMEEASKEIDE